MSEKAPNFKPQEEQDREAIRAAAVRDLQEVTSSFPTEETAECGRYTNAWNEESWEQDFDNHPLFMKQAPEDPANLPPLVEAMRQLKFDPEYNSPKELAERYKRDGNENFRLKKYRWAVENYTEAIKQGANDNELNSMLYGNRAASHIRLGNHRSALKDSLKSVHLNARNVKSVLRIAECYFNLKDYHTCAEYCKQHVLDHQPLEEYLSKSLKELAVKQEEEQEARSKQQLDQEYRHKLLQIVQQDRGIDLRGNLFHSLHPGTGNRHVELSQEGHLLWPVIFVYPEFSQSDFIEYFDEASTFQQQLEILFGDPGNRPAWDLADKYKPDNVRIGYLRHDAPDQMVPVDKSQTLGSILSCPDFTLIAANPACIKPLEKPQQQLTKKERIQVSLTDCLACSGCVTSAETVLISQQSHEEFLKVLSKKSEPASESSDEANSSNLTVVVSLSHQVIVSFAVQYAIEFQEAANRLASVFKSLGVDYVFDLTLARHFALIEAGREFVEVRSNKESSGRQLPILSTVCPGWVCYAEKTHGNLVPLLSRVKSPQQIMGSIIKEVWCKEQQIRGTIYHVTIMPCFDKKLEASRSNFMKSETGEKDIDSVLTPIEIQQILESRGILFLQIPLLPHAVDVIHRLSRDVACENNSNDDIILSHHGSGSGGHAENVLVYAARLLFQRVSTTHADLHYEVRRNSDFMEIQVSSSKSGDGDQAKLLFAIVNGFRNIQTLVQKIKRNKCEYDFVEVMACPSGCLNGGAQLKQSPISRVSVKGEEATNDSFAERTHQVYHSLQKIRLPLDPSLDPVRGLYDSWFPTQSIRDQVFYTDFKAVPKTQNLLTMTW